MPLIKDRPKAMLDVKGRTILERQLAALGGCGIRDVVVVRGYKKDQICLPGVSFVDNDRFADTGEVHSLFRAEHALAGPLLVLYGDILFESAVLEKLLRAGTDVAVVVDRAFHDTYRAGVPLPPGPLDLVVTETPPHGRRFVAPEAGSAVLRIGPEVAPEEAHGEFIGMAMFSARGSRALRAVHTELAAECAEGLERASLTKLIQAMIDRGQRVTAVEIHKGWMEIDTFEDYRRAWAEVSR